MALITPHMKHFIDEQKLAFVATVCEDGTANLSPKGTLIVWNDDHLVFAHLHSPQTVANLKHNPSIEINVVDVFTRKGYRFKGTARIVARGPLYEEIMDSFRGEDSHDSLREADRRVKGLVLVTVTQVRSLISPAYEDGSTARQSLSSGATIGKLYMGNPRASDQLLEVTN